jgi:ABC transporter with metal-binding/Fe-S-binding domain ATP-binding protein
VKVAVLYSGGKDSNYALYWALNQGWEVARLITFKPAREDSFMFHLPCIDLTKLQAKAIGIPHTEANVSGEKEKEVDEMGRTLAKLGVDGVVSGAVASEYQKTRIEGACEELSLRSFAPLWHKKPGKLLSDIKDAGFEVIFSGVYADGFSERWLGRMLDDGATAELEKLSAKNGINAAGEGGEYETLVLDGPFFQKRLDIRFRREWDGVRGKITVEKAKLKNKASTL